MNRKLFLFISLIALLALVLSASGPALASPLMGGGGGPPPPATAWFTDWITSSTTVSDGTDVSIAFDPGDGTPYISYYDATHGDLMLASPASGGNCGPNNSWWCRAVVTLDDVGQYSSIDIYAGGLVWNLGIAYHDNTHHSLKYDVYHCYLITCGWTYTTVDSSADPNDAIGRYPSLKFDSTGSPHIAYQVYDDPDNFPDNLAYYGLKYAYMKSSSNCGGGNWQCDSVVGSLVGATGFYPSLDLNSANKARIAYYDYDNGNLMYASAGVGTIGNCGPGGNTWQCDTIDGDTGSNPEVGLYPSLHVDKGASENPKIAYYDATNGKLKYAETPSSNDAYACGPLYFGVHSWRCVPVDSVGANYPLIGLSLAVDSAGYPIIAYQDASSIPPTKLKVARPAPAVGAPLGIGNCGAPPPGGSFNYWQCETIDYGGASSSVAGFVAVGVSPSGLAMAAYSDYDNYSEYNLKVAYQRFQVLLPLIKR
ncbi:hypothetical protein GW781_09250 [bacterium]|nr:hypothetical protein [bacterium]